LKTFGESSNSESLAEQQSMWQEWNHLSLDMINGLIHCLRQRFQECIEHDRKYIGHLKRKMHTRSSDECPRQEGAAVRFGSIIPGGNGPFVMVTRRVIDIIVHAADDQQRLILFQEDEQGKRHKIIVSTVERFVPG
jgi:hypothetical protein